MTDLVLAPKSEAAPEGIFYPEDPDLSRQQWVSKAHEAAAASWRAIGVRPVRLARRFSVQTVHALRAQPRGYGKKRHQWERTTECGQMMEDDGLWYWKSGPLGETTCLMCRRTVRERYENDLIYSGSGIADDMLDEYDLLQQEAMWEEQRRQQEGDFND